MSFGCSSSWPIKNMLMYEDKGKKNSLIKQNEIDPKIIHINFRFNIFMLGYNEIDPKIIHINLICECII